MLNSYNAFSHLLNMNIRLYVLLCINVIPVTQDSLSRDRVVTPDSLIGRDRVHFSRWIKTSTEGSSSTYTFEWMIKVSKNDCVKACKSTKACQYINYHVRTHTCALVRTRDDIEYSNGEEVELKPGYVFGMKSDWTMDTIADCDACASLGQCNMVDDSETTTNTSSNACRNSGCGFPNSPDFQGNMFSARSLIRQNTSNRSILCSVYGKWLPYFRGSYYYVNTGPLSWSDANAYCEHRSGHLAYIGSEDEDIFIAGLIGECCWGAWIGANDLDNEGTFVWSDGSAILYSNWRINEPNDHQGNEDCAGITDHEGFFWNDMGCAVKVPSICEFE